ADARPTWHGRNQRARGASADRAAALHPRPRRRALCRTVRLVEWPHSGEFRNRLPDRLGAMISAPGIDEIRAAAERIHGLVRRTPLLAAAAARESSERPRRLLLKLESLQV